MEIPCKALVSSCKMINLGDVTSYCGTNYFITTKGVYCTTLSYREMAKLQSVHGTGNVNYCPFPTMICGKNLPRTELISILNESSNCDRTVADEITTGLDRKHFVTTKMNTNSIIDTVSKSKMVVINGQVRPNVLFVVFASRTPFIVIGCRNSELEHQLKLSGLSMLVCTNNDGAKERMYSIIDNWKSINETLSESVDRLIRFIKWAPEAKSFLSSTISQSPKRDDKKLRFYLNPSDYTTPYYYHMAKELFKHSTYGGIHLRLSVVRDFTSTNLLLLHPWIGIVEVTDRTKLEELLKNDKFMVSLSMCLGLVVYHQDIADMIPENVNVSVQDYLIHEMPKTFDLMEWCDKRTVVNLDTDNIDGTSIGTMSVVREDLLLQSIAQGAPVLLPGTKHSETILGKKYPMFNDRTNPMDIPSDDKVIVNTLKHINSIVVDTEEIINSILDSSVGKAVNVSFGL